MESNDAPSASTSRDLCVARGQTTLLWGVHLTLAIPDHILQFAVYTEYRSHLIHEFKAVPHTLCCVSNSSCACMKSTHCTLYLGILMMFAGKIHVINNAGMKNKISIISLSHRDLGSNDCHAAVGTFSTNITAT